MPYFFIDLKIINYYLYILFWNIERRLVQLFAQPGTRVQRTESEPDTIFWEKHSIQYCPAIDTLNRTSTFFIKTNYTRTRTARLNT